MNEFAIIEHYFAKRALVRSDVLLGSGDDCALLQLPLHQALAVSMDTLVAGVHFPLNTAPADIAYKAVAVNLSDLAAMGAEPAWITGSITLPHIAEDWLTCFADGFFSLLDHYQVALVGGDLSYGPLSITLQVHGFVTPELALRRDNAQAGDLIYVTGTLGDAGLGLRCLNAAVLLPQADHDFVLARLNRPLPRIAAGLALRGIAHAAIDISDGLCGDVQHLLKRSNVGATLWLDQLPLSPALQRNLTLGDAWDLALTAGDDYELCFTIPAHKQQLLEKALANADCSYQQIGIIENQPGLRLLQPDGRFYTPSLASYDHFRTNS